MREVGRRGKGRDRHRVGGGKGEGDGEKFCTNISTFISTELPTARPTYPSSSANHPHTGSPSSETTPPDNTPDDPQSSDTHTTPPPDDTRASDTGANGLNHAGQSMDDNQESVRNVGVGIGTFILAALVVFVVFVVVVVYLGNRARRKREMREVASSVTGLGSRRRLRSLVSPKTPNSAATTTTKWKNVFQLPSKQCNVKQNNKVQNNHRPQSVNPSQSVNEFVAEPEVYDLGPVPARRSKRIKTPPDSPLLKGEPFTLEGYQMDSLKMGQNGPDPEVSYKQKFMNKDGKYHDSSTSVVTEIELEDLGKTTATGETMETKEKELMLEATESLPRSCLSSSSDASHGKSHRKSVTFSEDTSSRKRESSEDMTPPPPLPPRYETFGKRKHGLCIVCKHFT